MGSTARTYLDARDVVHRRPRHPQNGIRVGLVEVHVVPEAEQPAERGADLRLIDEGVECVGEVAVGGRGGELLECRQ